jgi:dTDP-4-dehydrorhamnose reductase
MLGNAVLRSLSGSPDLVTWGSVRGAAALRHFPEPMRQRIVTGVDVEHPDELVKLLARTRPDVVINCIGLVKQLADAKDPLSALPINALLPHRLARLAGLAGARLVHVSTDCVFAGTRGAYAESDVPDALDLYGRSKLLGEVDYPNAITLRTSIIGHELASRHGLIDWFLSQEGSVRGFTRAVFSGLPTVELARVIRDYVIPRPGMRGLYHVSAAPIAKYDLLRLVAAEYGKDIRIEPDAELVIDRSLDSTRFRTETGYVPPAWPQLVRDMRAFG